MNRNPAVDLLHWSDLCKTKYIFFLIAVPLAMLLAACNIKAVSTYDCDESSTSSISAGSTSATVSEEKTSAASALLKRYGTGVLGYMDLPVMLTTGKYNADELPVGEARSEFSARSYNVNDFPERHPEDALLVKMERYYNYSLQTHSVKELAETELKRYSADYSPAGFASSSIEDCEVNGCAARLVKFESAGNDFGIGLAGDNMYVYLWIDDGNSSYFKMQFIWNPEAGDYAPGEYIKTYSLQEK